jgi:hypothetical protein
VFHLHIRIHCLLGHTQLVLLLQRRSVRRSGLVMGLRLRLERWNGSSSSIAQCRERVDAEVAAAAAACNFHVDGHA